MIIESSRTTNSRDGVGTIRPRGSRYCMPVCVRDIPLQVAPSRAYGMETGLAQDARGVNAGNRQLAEGHDGTHDGRQGIDLQAR